MDRMLHILTRPDDDLPRDILAIARGVKSVEQVEVVDLTRHDANYDALLDSIFASTSIAVW